MWTQRRGERWARWASCCAPFPRITAAAAARSPTTASCSRNWRTPASRASANRSTTSAPITSKPTAPRRRSGAGCRGWRRGELVGAIAMTEPAAGSDLQGIRTRAAPRWRPLRRQRLEDVHHQRLARRSGHASSPRPIARAARQGHLAAHGRNRRPRRLSARPHARQDRHARPGHVRAVLRRRAACPARTLLGGDGRPGLRADDGASCRTSARSSRVYGGRGDRARASSDRSTTRSERHAFGKALIEFQNTRFKLAEVANDRARSGASSSTRCIVRYLAGTLDTATASMAKWWLTDMQCQVVDECLQLFGGYGYMSEYPIARMFADCARAADLRRHQRDHEGSHRAHAVMGHPRGGANPVSFDERHGVPAFAGTTAK